MRPSVGVRANFLGDHMTRPSNRRGGKARSSTSDLDRASAADVSLPDPEDTACLIAHGLGIRSVTGNTVLWHRPPTAAEEAFAAEILN